MAQGDHSSCTIILISESIIVCENVAYMVFYNIIKLNDSMHFINLQNEYNFEIILVYIYI